MKKTNVISKKIFPSSARRITNLDGKRVWLVYGVEYPSKRAYLQYLRELHNRSKELSNGKTIADIESEAELPAVPAEITE